MLLRDPDDQTKQERLGELRLGAAARLAPSSSTPPTSDRVLRDTKLETVACQHCCDDSNSMANWVEDLDTQVAAFLSDWSILTTLIAVVVVGVLVYPILVSNEPDTHPLLLARQSSVAPVRNKNESAVYRSPEVPHGYPLKTGLNVKDTGAPRWASGKDGDLRDIWREIQRGGTKGSDGKDIPAGVIMTVLGKQEVIEHDIAELSKEIQILGKHLKESGQKKIAIYLPNSMEYLMAIFGMSISAAPPKIVPSADPILACSFYGLTPVLLPYNLPHLRIYELLKTTEATCLICAAGNIPLDDVAEACPNIRLLTWVVEKTSRHMDWNGVPESAQGRLSVSVWHDLVEEGLETATSDLPSNDTGDAVGSIITIWLNIHDPSLPATITSFSHANFTSSIASLITALPLRQRFGPSDLVLPASSFNIPYVLCQTFAALFTHASVSINSVAEPGVDLALARRGVSPTVIIASAETMAKLHAQETKDISSVIQRVSKASQAQTMSAGRMPTDTLLFRLLAPSSSGGKPGQLRLILTSERLGAGSPKLTSTMLSDLRIFTRARIVYALTAATVCGAVAQTNVFDYRREDGIGFAPFGVPVSSVEVKLKGIEGDGQGSIGGNQPEGEVFVNGPAVAAQDAKESGWVGLGVKGRFREDGTLALI